MVFLLHFLIIDFNHLNLENTSNGKYITKLSMLSITKLADAENYMFVRTVYYDVRTLFLEGVTLLINTLNFFFLPWVLSTRFGNVPTHEMPKQMPPAKIEHIQNYL